MVTIFERKTWLKNFYISESQKWPSSFLLSSVLINLRSYLPIILMSSNLIIWSFLVLKSISKYQKKAWRPFLWFWDVEILKSGLYIKYCDHFWQKKCFYLNLTELICSFSRAWNLFVWSFLALKSISKYLKGQPSPFLWC